MFDWLFAWHGLDNLRYSIWNPEDHYKAESMQKQRALNPDLSLKDKYWNTTHEVLEDIGMAPAAEGAIQITPLHVVGIFLYGIVLTAVLMVGGFGICSAIFGKEATIESRHV